jgi:hypothetical protein
MAKEFNFFSPKTTTEAIISEVRIKIDASQYLSVQKFLQWSREYNIRLEVHTIASSHQIFQKCQNFLIFYVGILYFLKNLMGTCNSITPIL